MTDHGATSVVTGNLREEAVKRCEEAVKRCEEAGRMGEVQRDPLGNNSLALEPTAFFIGPAELVATAIHSAAYDEHYAYIRSLLIGAAAEWGQLGVALERMAEDFDQTGQTQHVDIDMIHTVIGWTAASRRSDL